MPRILYHLPFLLANSDVKILWGCDTKQNDKLTKAGLNVGLQSIKPYLEFVGLSIERLIVHQHVYAREVWFPMEGGCQDPVYNTWPILHMRRMFTQKIHLQELADQPYTTSLSTSNYNTEELTKLDAKPVLLVIQRSAGNKFTRNGHDLVRQWSAEYAEHIVLVLQVRTFPFI